MYNSQKQRERENECVFIKATESGRESSGYITGVTKDFLVVY